MFPFRNEEQHLHKLLKLIDFYKKKNKILNGFSISTSDFVNNLLATAMIVIRVKCERNCIRKSFFSSSDTAAAIDFEPIVNLHKREGFLPP